jgi:hypothetical protein
MVMDEAEITKVEAPVVEVTEPKAAISEYKEFNPLYKHFGVEPSPRTDDALEQIWEYAKSQSDSKDIDSIILQVIRFNHELGSPSLGESAYSKMYNYLTVYKQFKEKGDLLSKLKKN